MINYKKAIRKINYRIVRVETAKEALCSQRSHYKHQGKME